MAAHRLMEQDAQGKGRNAFRPRKGVMMVPRRYITPIRLYLACVACSSALILALSMIALVAERIVPRHLAWFVGSIALITVATARPVELRPHVRFSVRTAPQLMAAILLGPPQAIIVTAVGVCAGYTFHLFRGRYNATDLFFNSGQSVLATAAAAFSYKLVGDAALGAVAEPLALATAAEAMHLSNKLLVAGAIAFSGQGSGVIRTFQDLVRDDPLQYAALLVTGIMGVLLAREGDFWAVPLLIAPLAFVEYTLVKQREEAERARKLAVMEQAVALKSEFVAGLTHDLRSPLTVVKLFADLLAHRSDEYEEDQREAIEALNLNADRLADLIEKMLQLSQLDAGMITLQPTASDAPALIQQALDHLAARAEHQGVNLTLSVTPPIPPIELDPMRFEQVVTNLVDSAIKFTPPGGEVHVTIACRDETLAIHVIDRGLAIPPEALPHIFDRFSNRRLVSNDQRRTGGLGLVIAKELVELHGGTITAESGRNDETIFTVGFPYVPPESRAARSGDVMQGLTPAQ